MDDLAQPFRRRLVACGAAAWAAALWPRIAAATTSQAKTWPNRPLKIVVPYAPGGPHITCEALNRMHGSAALHVPYRGLAPLTQDLVARHIGAAFGARRRRSGAAATTRTCCRCALPKSTASK